MKIENVVIDNWQSPGACWWKKIEARHDEPLIRATLELTLSWDEYHALLNKDERTGAPNVANETRYASDAREERPRESRWFWRLIQRFNGWRTRPGNLSWSSEHGAWSKTSMTWMCEWTSLWSQDEYGRWRSYVSYGRDLPSPNQ